MAVNETSEFSSKVGTVLWKTAKLGDVCSAIDCGLKVREWFVEFDGGG